MTRAMAAGALVCALLLTSGCGGDSSSSSEKTPSPSPRSASASTTPTPSAPALPEAATKNTKAGAIAFVRHYVRLINHAQATGDVGALRTASAKKCVSCRDAMQSIEELYDSGGHLEGGDWRSGRALASRNASGWLVTVRVTYGKQTVHRPGEDPQDLPGGPHTLNFTVNLVDSKVVRWTRAS